MAVNAVLEYSVLGGVLANLLPNEPVSLPTLAYSLSVPLMQPIPELAHQNLLNGDVSAESSSPETEETNQPGDRSLNVAKGVVITVLGR